MVRNGPVGTKWSRISLMEEQNYTLFFFFLTQILRLLNWSIVSGRKIAIDPLVSVVSIIFAIVKFFRNILYL